MARLAFRYLLLPEGDANEGTFRPLKLILPEGTIVSAGPTSPMGAYNSCAAHADRFCHPRARPAMPDRVAAGHYGTFSTLAYAGRLPDTGLFWQCHDSGFGGWGALNDMDGPGPFRTMCHGDTRLIPIETHEATYPFMIESFGLRADFGGPGQFRGGLGLERRYLMLAPCRISTRFERTIWPAWGMNGGGEGQPGHVLIERADGTTQVALKETLMLKAGDRVRIRTGGGGGYGDPKLARSRARPHRLMRGYVSPEAARDIYGLAKSPQRSVHRHLHRTEGPIKRCRRHRRKLEKLGAKCFARRPEGQKGFYETKFHGPDKVTFDITDHPWRGSAPIDGRWSCAIRTPAFSTTNCQRSMSSFRYLAKCAGVSPTGVGADALNFSATSGNLIVRWTASESFSMIAAGVFAGASRPAHDVASKPGNVSAMAGTPGANGSGCKPVTPSARSYPCCT